MTGANQIGFLPGDAAVNTDNIISSSKKDSNGDNKVMFAMFMRQTSVAQKDVSKVDSNSVDGSYNEFKYKESNIERKDVNPIKEKLDSSKDKIEDFEEQVVEKVSEVLEVDEEQLVETMEMLGFTPIDLLDPAKLAEVTVELTETVDSIELLTSDTFKALMMDLSEMVEELIDELELTPNQFDELVAMMEVAESVEITPELTEMIEETVAKPDNDANLEMPIKSAEVEDTQELETSEKTPENEMTETVMSSEVKEDDAETESSGFEFKQEHKSDNESNEVVTHHVVTEQQVVEGDYTVQVEPAVDSYMSTDTVEIIEQIVEKVRTSVNSEISTMEMQLNPENLGKLYINISSKEGNVSAQIMATNDLVKEALENQMIELRENLSQAGIKVDALEVTVASHEFERNLEQDQSRQEQEGARQEEMSNNRRRNISINSLDDLAGLMTEEESLVAQMMLDNGNSVDLTA